jgi:hypothetical protein
VAKVGPGPPLAQTKTMSLHTGELATLRQTWATAVSKEQSMRASCSLLLIQASVQQHKEQQF